MSNLLFPKVRGLGWTITKNPTFSTEIQSSLAGREVRVQNFQNPIWEFTLAYEYLLNDPRLRDENEQTPLETLVGFFLARGGQFDDFLLNESDLTCAMSEDFWKPAKILPTKPQLSTITERSKRQPRITRSPMAWCSLRMRRQQGIRSLP